MTFLSTAFAAGDGTINVTKNPGGVNLDSVKNVGDLISAGIGAAFLISFLLVFVMLIWGGLQWVTSGGDKDNTQKARDRITGALVGLAIIAAAWALMQLVSFFFGVDVMGGFTLPSAAK